MRSDEREATSKSYKVRTKQVRANEWDPAIEDQVESLKSKTQIERLKSALKSSCSIGLHKSEITIDHFGHFGCHFEPSIEFYNLAQELSKRRLLNGSTDLDWLRMTSTDFDWFWLISIDFRSPNHRFHLKSPEDNIVDCWSARTTTRSFFGSYSTLWSCKFR